MKRIRIRTLIHLLIEIVAELAQRLQRRHAAPAPEPAPQPIPRPQVRVAPAGSQPVRLLCYRCNGPIRHAAAWTVYCVNPQCPVVLELHILEFMMVQQTESDAAARPF